MGVALHIGAVQPGTSAARRQEPDDLVAQRMCRGLATEAVIGARHDAQLVVADVLCELVLVGYGNDRVCRAVDGQDLRGKSR